MVEKKKTEDENKEEKSPTKDIGEGSEPKAATLYEQTNTATERLEKANAKTEELLNRQEALYEKQKLGGGSEAGQEPVKETEDEKWAKDAKERYAGTGMDPTPNKEDGKIE